MSTVAIVLLVLLLVMLLGGLPTWPHSQSWGYTPSTVVLVILIVVIVLAVTGRL